MKTHHEIKKQNTPTNQEKVTLRTRLSSIERNFCTSAPAYPCSTLLIQIVWYRPKGFFLPNTVNSLRYLGPLPTSKPGRHPLLPLSLLCKAGSSVFKFSLSVPSKFQEATKQNVGGLWWAFREERHRTLVIINSSIVVTVVLVGHGISSRETGSKRWCRMPPWRTGCRTENQAVKAARDRKLEWVLCVSAN